MAVYFDSKRKTWYCQFKYRDWTGAAKTTTKRGFARKKDALQYEMDFKNHSEESTNITLNTLAAKYLEDYKINRKPSSYATIRQRISDHILPHLGNVLVGDITPLRIKEWQNHLKQTGIGDSSIRSINTTFSALLNYAVRYYGLPSNPFAQTGKTGKPKKKCDFWEVDEFLKVAEYFSHTEDVVVFNLLFWSGMRIGELESLTESDFNFDENTISISKSYSPSAKKVLTPKTPHSVRVIAMPESIMEMVQDFFSRFAELPTYPFMVVGRVTYRNRLYAYAKKAGIKPITLHDLRHSHASYLIQHASASLPSIARRLGHSSAAITLSTYAHMYHDSDSDIAKGIDDIVKSSSKVRHNE